MDAPEPNDATPFLPEKKTLPALREAAAGCRGCHLWRPATQTVFGEGLKKARVLFVGERRMHQTPKKVEIDACKPWLEEELRVVSPDAVVPLGATAAKALLGSSFRVTQQRGQVLADTGLAPVVVATIHPSAILRQRTDEERIAEREAFAADLAVVASALD